MNDYSKPLGDTVKRTRSECGLTQAKVADRINIDTRTVLNIENYNANPKMEILYPLVRTLHIDPWDIFYPELRHQSSGFRQLQLLLLETQDEDIEALLPIVQAALTVLKSKNTLIIK